MQNNYIRLFKALTISMIYKSLHIIKLDNKPYFEWNKVIFFITFLTLISSLFWYLLVYL